MVKVKSISVSQTHNWQMAYGTELDRSGMFSESSHCLVCRFIAKELTTQPRRSLHMFTIKKDYFC